MSNLQQSVKPVEPKATTENKIDMYTKIDAIIKPLMSMTGKNEVEAKSYLMLFKLNIEKARECTSESVMKALFLCASIDLNPNPMLGEVYFIPRTNNKLKGAPKELNFQIGYKGYRTLARRNPEVLTIDSHVVYENDFFEMFEETINTANGIMIIKENLYKHVPALANRGNIKGFFAKVRLMSKKDLIIERVLFVTLEQVEQYRDLYTDSRDKEGNLVGPWIDSFESMGKKVPISILCKDLPLDSQTATALEAEAAQQFNPEAITIQAKNAGFIEEKKELTPEIKKETPKKTRMKTEDKPIPEDKATVPIFPKSGIGDAILDDLKEVAIAGGMEEEQVEQMIEEHQEAEENVDNTMTPQEQFLLEKGLRLNNSKYPVYPDGSFYEISIEERPLFCYSECSDQQKKFCTKDFCVNGLSESKTVTEIHNSIQETAEKIKAEMAAKKEEAPASPPVVQQKFLRRTQTVQS